VLPHFEAPFGIIDLDFAGMVPRAHVNTVVADSPAAMGNVHAGDVVQAITVVQTKSTINFPSQKMLRETINAAGQNDQSIVLTLADAGGAVRQTAEIIPNAKLGEHRRGLGVGLDNDERNTTVAVVEPDSAAGRAGIKPGWQITKIGDQAVSNFFQIRRMLAGATAGVPLSVTALTADGPVTVQFSESQGEIDAMKYMTFSTDLLAVLHERTELRKTANPIVASEWGAAETRDFILQFYVTLHRMFTGSVPLGQAMGPVGIVRFGAMSAARGPDWLVWFLSMISANLAVANFLPIPVMDGGLFVLLLLEGVQGRPLSPKTQQVIQMVGLAFILSLFLLVTYQDITR
jgi:RIP metalloprotease RseP